MGIETRWNEDFFVEGLLQEITDLPHDSRGISYKRFIADFEIVPVRHPGPVPTANIYHHFPIFGSCVHIAIKVGAQR